LGCITTYIRSSPGLGSCPLGIAQGVSVPKLALATLDRLMHRKRRRKFKVQTLRTCAPLLVEHVAGLAGQPGSPGGSMRYTSIRNRLRREPRVVRARAPLVDAPNVRKFIAKEFRRCYLDVASVSLLSEVRADWPWPLRLLMSLYIGRNREQGS